jgi:hypothetical protein
LMLLRYSQPANVPSSILDTEFGISIDGKPLQFLKAWSPIVVTEFGILMLPSSSLELKALRPIVVMKSGI